MCFHACTSTKVHRMFFFFHLVFLFSGCAGKREREKRGSERYRTWGSAGYGSGDGAGILIINPTKRTARFLPHSPIRNGKQQLVKNEMIGPPLPPTTVLEYREPVKHMKTVQKADCAATSYLWRLWYRTRVVRYTTYGLCSFQAEFSAIRYAW